jgi:2,4-dienoyl-CoA reductase-like NADH-dependent reductase (Old Yellow Enzyme family)/thioredoxin reductase
VAPTPRYPNLFRPGRIGTLEVPNRIVMAPMATNFASETGGLTDTLIDFYERRAMGGIGLIIAEHCCVDFPCGKGGAAHLRLDDDRFVPGISRLAEAVHYYGSKIAIQINHSGPSGVPAKTEGLGPVGASNITYASTLPMPRMLERKEIEVIIEKFAQAVLRAKKAGFDAVELHGGHCYLMAHFMSPLTNQRTDEYGGDLEGRLRFPIQIIRRCRELVGDAYPIMIRMSGDEFIEGGRGIDESKQVARVLAATGIDAIHITAGTHAAVHPSGTVAADPIAYEQGWRVYLATEIKSVVDIPVIAVGVIREPTFAEEILREKKADFVALGRAFLADPDWAAKAKTGQEDQIRQCVSCNEGCIRRRVFMDLPIRCALNTEVGRFSRFRAKPIVGKAKRVLVVGGGPGGMEAARVLKIRGHDVTLWEKKDVLGGQVLMAAVPAFKEKLATLIEFFKIQMQCLDIPVQLNQEATPEKIMEFNPDALILATGAVPIVPTIPGIECSPLISIEDVLTGNYTGSGSSVVVMGGGVKGAEVALYLAAQGEHVTVIEMMDQLAFDIEPVSRQDLLARLSRYQVQILTNTKVLACEEKGLRVRQTNQEEMFVQADKTVSCLGYRSERSLETQLKDEMLRIHTIGDCRKPRMIIHAIAEAYDAASKI